MPTSMFTLVKQRDQNHDGLAGYVINMCNRKGSFVHFCEEFSSQSHLYIYNNLWTDLDKDHPSVEPLILFPRIYEFDV